MDLSLVLEEEMDVAASSVTLEPNRSRTDRFTVDVGTDGEAFVSTSTLPTTVVVPLSYLEEPISSAANKEK